MGYQEFVVKIPKKETPEDVYAKLEEAVYKAGCCRVLPLVSELTTTLKKQRLSKGDRFFVVIGERSNGREAIQSAGYQALSIDDVIAKAGLSPLEAMKAYEKLFRDSDYQIIEEAKEMEER